MDSLHDPFAPLGGLRAMPERSDAEAVAPDNWRPVLPAPEPLPTEPRHPRLGSPSRVWIYRGRDGATLFAVCRFEVRDAAGDPLLDARDKPRKEVLPLVFGTLGRRRGWHWKAPGEPRPLYGLDRIAARPEAPVLVTEGEKSADAAGLLLPDHVAVSWQGGSNAIGTADWAPLAGREVVIWPDNDAPGIKAARALVGALRVVGAARVAVVRIPPGWPAGWDVADPLPEGADEAALRRMLGEALVEHAPRAAAESVVPPGFALTTEGLFAVDCDDGEGIRICGPLTVEAVTHDGAGRGYGRLLRWRGLDGEPHVWAMPMTLLAGDGTELRARLLDEGLDLEPGRRQREALVRYVQRAKPAARVRVVHRVGWHETSAGRVFVLPDAAFGPPGAPRLVLQTERPDALPPFGSSGTLGEWQEEVAALCRGNSRLMLSVSLAFTPPLLALLGAEGGGVHLRGGSSIGKTAALAAAGSVWGGGGLRGWVRSWRTTDNGLEGIAQAHCDLPVCLDEMGEAPPEAVAAGAYMLANGGGKSRARTDGAVRRAPEWRVLFLSSGEEGLADRLSEARGGPRRVRAGQQVRVVDLPADAGTGLGLFEELHGEASAGALADRVKAAAARLYGTAGWTFLATLAADATELTREAQTARESFKARHVPVGAAGQVARVADRFSIVAVAGEMAAAFGIVPWAKDEAEAAAARCFRSWLAGREGGTAAACDAAEVMAALARVRHFLVTHGPARFEVVGDGTAADRLVIDRVGWRKRLGRAGDGEGGGAWHYCIPPEAWHDKVCAGLDGQAAAQALRNAGFLLPQKGGRLARMERVGLDNPVRVYAVSEAILSGFRSRAELAAAEEATAGGEA